MQLAIIETEPNGAAWLASRLVAEGFVSRLFVTARQAMDEGALRGAHAAILDIGPQFEHPCAAVQALRSYKFDKPLIVLSGSGGWKDRVDALDAGADDFLVKPVRAEEVAARLRAVLRRAAGRSGDVITAGPFALDLKARLAFRDGVLLDLTRHELRLLRMLMLFPDRVYSNQEIRDQLYPQPGERSFNAVEVCIARLRRKVGHGHIRTIRGVGYRFDPSEAETGPGLPADDARAWTPVI